MGWVRGATWSKARGKDDWLIQVDERGRREGKKKVWDLARSAGTEQKRSRRVERIERKI